MGNVTATFDFIRGHGLGDLERARLSMAPGLGYTRRAASAVEMRSFGIVEHYRVT